MSRGWSLAHAIWPAGHARCGRAVAAGAAGAGRAQCPAGDRRPPPGCFPEARCNYSARTVAHGRTHGNRMANLRPMSQSQEERARRPTCRPSGSAGSRRGPRSARVAAGAPPSWSSRPGAAAFLYSARPCGGKTVGDRLGVGRDRGAGDDASLGDRVRRGRAQGRPVAQDHVSHHGVERDRGTRVTEGDVIARLDRHGPGRPARGREGLLDQRQGRAGPPEGPAGARARAAVGAWTPRSPRRPRRAPRSRYAEALLDYTEIRAPFAGVITAKRAFVGEAVSPFGSSPSGGGSGRRDRHAGRVLEPLRRAPTSTEIEPREARGPSSRRRSRSTPSPTRRTTDSFGQIVPAADRQKGDRARQGRVPRRRRQDPSGPLGAGLVHRGADAGQDAPLAGR